MLNVTHAEQMIAHLSKEAERVEAAMRTLKFISGQTGSVVLNFSRSTYASPFQNRHVRTDDVDMFADGLERHGIRMTDAFMEARSAVEDFDDPKSPNCSYVTSIVLHPNGTWTEQYLFPL